VNQIWALVHQLHTFLLSLSTNRILPLHIGDTHILWRVHTGSTPVIRLQLRVVRQTRAHDCFRVVDVLGARRDF
jgi:hypothetical protein